MLHMMSSSPQVQKAIHRLKFGEAESIEFSRGFRAMLAPAARTGQRPARVLSAAPTPALAARIEPRDRDFGALPSRSASKKTMARALGGFGAPGAALRPRPAGDRSGGELPARPGPLRSVLDPFPFPIDLSVCVSVCPCLWICSFPCFDASLCVCLCLCVCVCVIVCLRDCLCSRVFFLRLPPLAESILQCGPRWSSSPNRASGNGGVAAGSQNGAST